MNKVTGIAMGIILVALVVATSLAVYYRNESLHYRQQLEVSREVPDPDDVVPAAVPAAHDDVSSRSVETVAVASNTEGPLKDRIRELERLVHERESQILALQQASSNWLAGARQNRPGPRDFTDPGRTNDVARRAEFEKRRQEMQQTVQNAFAKKAAFLLDRDTSKMSEDEKKEYGQMVTLLDETWKLVGQMQQDVPRDQRHEMMHQIGENVSTLEPLLLSERQREIRDLGATMGYSAAEADKLVTYVNEIVDVTSVNTMFPQFRNNRNGGGSRAPARPAASQP